MTKCVKVCLAGICALVLIVTLGIVMGAILPEICDIFPEIFPENIDIESQNISEKLAEIPNHDVTYEEWEADIEIKNSITNEYDQIRKQEGSGEGLVSTIKYMDADGNEYIKNNFKHSQFYEKYLLEYPELGDDARAQAGIIDEWKLNYDLYGPPDKVEFYSAPTHSTQEDFVLYTWTHDGEISSQLLHPRPNMTLDTVIRAAIGDANFDLYTEWGWEWVPRSKVRATFLWIGIFLLAFVVLPLICWPMVALVIWLCGKCPECGDTLFSEDVMGIMEENVQDLGDDIRNYGFYLDNGVPIFVPEPPEPPPQYDDEILVIHDGSREGDGDFEAATGTSGITLEDPESSNTCIVENPAEEVTLPQRNIGNAISRRRMIRLKHSEM